MNCQWTQINDSEIECIHCGKILKANLAEGNPQIECGAYEEDTISKLGRMSREYKRWFLAGMPTRSMGEIAQIFGECMGCEFFGEKSENKGTCTICNCQIKRNSTYLNKGALATSFCPLKPPKWGRDTEEVIHKSGSMGTNELPPDNVLDVKVKPNPPYIPQIFPAKKSKSVKGESSMPESNTTESPKPKRRSCCS